MPKVLAALKRHVLPIFITISLGSALALGVVITTDEQGNATVTINLEGGKVTAPERAVEQAESSEVGEHDGLRTEVPENVPLEDIRRAQDQQEKLAESDQLPIVTPDAAPSQRGCVTRRVQNFSSRRGVRPRLFVMHYTVSPNRPGWGDVNAIAGLFDRPAFSASSHYIIDSEGHCLYIVRESDKAWTQATANPVSISIEVINSGKEGRLAGPAGLAKIGRVVADSTRRWEIPLRVGKVSGCRVVQAGVVDHRALGPCGGGHVDVSPYTIAPVLAAAKKARGSAPAEGLIRQDYFTCRKIRWWRTHGRPNGKPERNAIRRRDALKSRGVRCGVKGPVKA